MGPRLVGAGNDGWPDRAVSRFGEISSLFGACRYRAAARAEISGIRAGLRQFAIRSESVENPGPVGTGCSRGSKIASAFGQASEFQRYGFARRFSTPLAD